MAESGKEKGQHYEALKQRLWNQPRPRQFLERLEHHGARYVLLEKVAGLFVSGQPGEAEILSAFYGDLLRNQDRTEVLRRITDVRVISLQIQQDLFLLANGLYQAKDPEACARKLGLSDRLIAALTAIREGPPDGLDLLLKRLAEEYSKKLQSESKRAADWGKDELALLIELKRRADLKVVLLKLHENLLHLIRELYRLKGWKAYRTVGYGDFSEFSIKGLGLSEQLADRLVLVREQADQVTPGELLLMMIKGYVASVRPKRKGK